MNAFTGGGTETEVWKDTLQTGQPAICLPGSPLHPAGKAASAAELCPAPHRPLEMFPLAAVYWLSGNTYPLIWAGDCERASDYLCHHHNLIIHGEQQAGAGSHGRLSGCGQLAAVKCVREMREMREMSASCPLLPASAKPQTMLPWRKHPHSPTGGVQLSGTARNHPALSASRSKRGWCCIFHRKCILHNK